MGGRPEVPITSAEVMPSGPDDGAQQPAGRMRALNAVLNGIDNIEVRGGSRFEAAAGFRPDRGRPALSRLYTRPTSSTAMSTSRATSSRVMLAELPRHLEEGAVASLQGNWIRAAGARWRAPLARGRHG